ncbi:MAG: metal ABC transporter substrate-binding protein [Candidatus Omnitrophota bacterium]
MLTQKTIVALVLSLLPLFSGNLLGAEKLNVVATTTTLSSIAQEVAGDKIGLQAIASTKQNIHHYAPTPRDVLKIKRADVLIHEGLDLEAWRQPLLEAAGNRRFLGEGEYSIDVSRGVLLLEIPATFSRAEGDIHVFGNPHYVGDPGNAKIIALNIAEGLAKVDPENADFFRGNATAFNKKLDAKIKDWETRMAGFRGVPVVTYHRSWSYFIKRFGLSVIGEVEHKPGIPPTAKHLAGLIQQMKDKKAKVIIKEPFEETRAPKKIAEETGAQVVTLSQSVGEPQEAKDYISLMEQNISLIEWALAGQKGGVS